MSSSMGQIGLTKASVLYIGSAVPLETAVGIESIQMPCRDRYTAAIGPDMKVAGIDATLTVFSSGITMQYTGGQSNVTWFPMQSFHVSAAVKAVSNAGSLQFVEVDLPEAECSNHPPMFAFIARRTKGVKVLECHVFICKSVEAAMALVQATSYAFEHREGWMSEGCLPPAQIGSAMTFGSGDGVRIVPGQQAPTGLDSHLVQRFTINNAFGQTAACPAPAPQQPKAPAMQMVPASQTVPMTLQNQYFANWNPYCGQAMMFVPGSPFYPGDAYMHQQKKKRKKRCKKKKKKKKKDSESDTEAEYYIVKRNGEYCDDDVEVIYKDYRREPNNYEIFAPSHPQAVNQYVREYNYYAGDDYDYDQAMMDYNAATAQYQADLDRYYGATEYPYGAAEYPYDTYDPYVDYPYGPYDGYNGLVDDLGYYP